MALSSFYDPNYEKDIEKLVTLFQEMGQDVLSLLSSIDFLSLTPEEAARIVKQMDKIFEESINDIDQASSGLLDIVAKDALTAWLFSLGIVTTTIITEDIRKQIEKTLKNELHKQFTDRMKTDYQNDTRIIAGNMRKQLVSIIEKGVGQSIRNRVTKHPLSSEESKRTLDLFKKEIEKSIGTGYVDKANRVWKPDTYANVITQTKVMETFNQTLINEGLLEGRQYGIISGPPAVDACNRYIGKTVKLDPSAPGNYPTYEELRMSREVFHPFCRHWIEPIEDHEVGE